jgi:asparagine synthase (glutamine-hydrolysing)
MCGIAGLLLGHQAEPAALHARARAMAGAVAHRGPDGEGVWVDAPAGLALAQRRLAIIDLSEAGAQPMLSACGRWAITYNGEFFNYRAVRAELEAAGRHMRGHSDTEVLVEAIALWGVEAVLPRLDAMFAFAAWDRAERVLWLARDHAGIKPLAWARTPSGLLFGSELPSLEAAGSWTPEIDAEAVAGYLGAACIAAPRTVFRGVRKLPAGGLLRVAADGSTRESLWFDAKAEMRAGLAAPRRADAAAIAEELDALLTASVRAQLVADVKLGAFLSGGIDSSSVVAAMGDAAHAFTIGFDDPAFDESAEAAAVARHLGVRHTVLRATAADALALAERIPAVFDEPFADQSALPTLLLSRLTRDHVTVALSGDGGDELFGGYRRHLLAAGLWPRAQRLPLRRLAGRALTSVPPGWWDAALRALPGAPRRPGETLHKLGAVLGADDLDAVHARLVSPWADPAGVATAAFPRAAQDGLPEDPLARMRLLDFTGYMTDDVLAKVDRAAMSVALEVRVPLLSPPLIRFAFALPSAALVRDGAGKAPLRDVLAKRLPRALFEREKTGFGIPLASWLRGPLRGWAQDLLESRSLRDSGLVALPPVRAAFAEHLSGRRDHGPGLWSVLMLAGWLQARKAS